jgi:hypothetical protein
METVAHEGRHATQDDSLNGKDTEEYTPEELEALSVDDSDLPYEEQAKESDALGYADSKMRSEEMRSKFGNDPNYQEARNMDNDEMANAAERYNSVNSSEEYNEKYAPELTPENNPYSTQNRLQQINNETSAEKGITTSPEAESKKQAEVKSQDDAMHQ